MKKRVLSILLALCMLIGLLPMLPVAAAEGDLPEKLYIAPTAEGNIPSQIDVYPDPSGGQNQYHLYLPGNAAAGSCFLSWEDGLSASMGGRTYASGALPIPAPGETETVTFTKGGTTKTFIIRTYKGSETVHPIFFELDESQGTIAAMLENKNNTCTGSVIIDGKTLELEQIKGRGNATWRDDKEKKPFNFKLSKNEKKLALPWIDCEKTRKWTLLSNVNDRSLLRNKVAYDLAHQMGIGFDSAAVDIWLNGAYWGTYQLTPKTDAYVTDDGFLLEDNNIVDDEDPSFNMGNMIINIKEIGDNLIIAEGGDPDNPSSQSIQAVKSKIQSYFQDVWNALSASNGVNSKGKHYSDYFDVDSMAKFYLLHEFIKNLEVDGGSIFLTRNGMADTDKLIAGPAWDYDNSMGYNGSNGSMASGGSGWPSNARTTNYASLSVGNWYITGRNRGKLFGTFSTHKDFLDKTYEVYNQYYALFDDVQQNVRRQAALIEDSAEMNFVRTVKEDKNNFDFPSHNTKFDEGTPYEVNYKEAQVWSEYVDNLVTYTSGRAKFFHDQMYVENTCEHDYQAVVTEPTCTTDGYTTYTCTKCGDSYIGNVITAPGHNFEDGVCTRCGAYAMKVYFMCDEGVTIDVAKTQAEDSEIFENVTFAYPRNKETGEIDISGDGQVNFVVNAADGYQIDTVSASPGPNFNNLKAPDETGIENGYRLTKIIGNVTVTVSAFKSGPPDPGDCEHDFTAEDIAATCTEPAKIRYTCSKCGYFYEESKGSAPEIETEINVPSGVTDKRDGYTYGTVEKITYYSTTAGRSKNANVQLPANYDPNKKYPVMYILHGVMGSENDMLGNGTIVQNLVADGLAEEMILVFPNMWSSAESSRPGGINQTTMEGYDRFHLDLINDLMPYMAEHYPVKEGKENTAVCGFSQGGRETLLIGLYHPDQIGYLCAISSAPGIVAATDSYMSHPGVFEEDEIKYEGETPYLIMMCSGNRDSVVGNNPQIYHQIYESNGIVHTWWEIPNADHGGATSSGVYNFAKYAFKVQGDGAPLGHDWNEGEITAPTCTAQGYTTYTCSRCGDSYTDNEVDALGHDYKAADQPEPTCAGFVTIVYTCTRCGDSFTEEIAPMPHDYKAVVTAPTCTDKGYTTYTCSRCGDSYTGDEVAALQHNYVNGVCTRCGAVDPDYVPPANKRELDKTIKDAALYPEDDYTPESYVPLTAAVAAAQSVMDKEDATQEEVDAAAQAVKDAIAGLEKKPDALDKDALIAALSAAEALKPEEYTEKSAKDLVDAITAAKDALSNAADQDAIDAAVAALEGVVDNLEKKPTFLFDDVQDENKFYFDPVYWAFYADPQITKGTDDTHFGPEDPCTRGHVVTFLWRAAGEPAPTSATTPFTDLKPGAFYERAVAWAVEKGITKGLTDTTFGPDATCTRSQIVTFLWRFKEEPAPKSTQTPFTDVNPDGFYMKAVAWAVEEGITKGLTDTTFGPEDTCTRGQVVTFLHRATQD